MRRQNLERSRSDHPTPENSADRLAQPEEYGEECGGDGGVPYRVFVSSPLMIRSVRIWHRQHVDGIQLVTDDAALPRIGGTGRHHDIRIEEFFLDRDEFITGLTVDYWNYIDRLIFHTNRRDHGPFGGSGGRVRKEIRSPAGRGVCGLAGHHWEFVDSIQLLIV